jgi:hypothetical protein
MIWYPLTQHLPHLHIHHKFNGKSDHDVDYVGCYRRDVPIGKLFNTFIIFLDHDPYYMCLSKMQF